MTRYRRRRGFSLIELLVVVGIVLTLLALLLPALAAVRQAAENRQSINNMKNVCLATIHCADVNKRMMPPAFGKHGASPAAASLHVHLLPFLEEAKLYTSYMKNEGKGDTANAKVRPYLDPNDASTKDKTDGVQNYAGNLRVFSTKGVQTKYDADMPELKAIEPNTAKFPATFTDGTSNTVLFATKYGVCGDGGSKYAAEPNSKFAAFFGQNAAKVKAHPADTTATFQLSPGPKECACSPLMAQSFTKKGLLVGMADGSVRTVSTGISPQTWNSALQPNDGMPLGKDWDD